MLNLFGYTGGFSIYAAAGGAAHTTTVDVAREAIAAARRNLERNGLASDAAQFHAEDAFAFLERAGRERVAYDLVISDPPSFAPNRQSLPTALRAYRRLHRLCAAVVAPGGSCARRPAPVTSTATPSPAPSPRARRPLAAPGSRWRCAGPPPTIR